MAISDKLKKAVQPYLDAEKLHVDVGILSGATPSGETKSGISLPVLGAIHEFGTATIPQRSFMRSTVAEKQKAWGKMAGAYLKANPKNITGALTMLGEAASKDMQAKIESNIAPKLKKATIKAKARRGKENPELALVDTGAMEEAISYEVRQ